MRAAAFKRLVLACGFLLALAGLAIGNDFYTHGNFPSPSSPATSASMRAEFDLITAGFAKLPALSGNANKVVVINSGATGLTTTTGQLSLAGNFSFTGAFNTTFTQVASATFTLPAVSGIFATLNGTEVFTNKSIDGSQITSAVAQAVSATNSSTVTTNANLTGPITSVGNATSVASQTGTGSTFVMSSSPSVSNATLTGTVAGGATYSSVTLDAGLVLADPVTSLGITSKQYADQHGFTTGDVKLTLKTAADTSWVLMNDGTIGDASSGATTRANADTSALFTLLWTNVVDQWAPVSTGRGGSASADFAAHKTIALPKTLGRALAGYGVGTTQEVTTTSSANGFTTLANNTKWVTGMAVVATAISGYTTTAVNSTTYYVVRISSTNIRLATTLALAQTLNPDITVSGSGSATFTYTFTSRAIGEQAGEEAHAQNVNELLAHTHNLLAQIDTTGTVVTSKAGSSGVTSVTTQSAGGNVAMNLVQPTAYLNVMVKL